MAESVGLGNQKGKRNFVTTENSFAAPGNNHVINHVKHQPLLWLFVVLAVGFRIFFQLFSGRVWEDALILNTVTSNFWAGKGLTHQVTEVPIQSFSSVIWMVFSLIGNSVGQGVFFLKIISLLATAATIWFAYSILVKWNVPKAGIVLVLGFLSFEQIHVTFGVAGMESQFSTAFILAGIWVLVNERGTFLALSATLAPLVRPELIFWTFIVVLIFMVRPRLLSIRGLAIAFAPLIAWVLFAALYYGTFIPQTVTAKSLIGTTNVSRSGLANGLTFSFNSWERFAPYFSNYFTASAWLPRSVGIWIVALLVILFLFGTYHISRISLIWALPALLVPMFVLYVGFFNVSNYHMWYVPPFSAVLVLYAGAAFILFPPNLRPLSWVLSFAILIVYLMPSVSYFQHEAYVQKNIDIGVRELAGEKLNELMKPGDTVILEPLGFLGSQVAQGAITDYPGLASRVMTEALQGIPIANRNMGSAARALRPNFIVVRQGEWQSFDPEAHPELQDYTLIESIGDSSSGDLEFTGATYSNSDRYFEIYAR